MKAITIGSAMTDIIVLVGNDDVERMTMHNATSSFLLLEQGRKIEALSITSHIGGGAVNAAVSLSRLGCETSTLIKIGCDANGERVLERLASEGVLSDCVVQTSELPTGTAVMVSSHDKNATIFTQRGANTLFRSSDLAANMFDGLGLVYVTNLSDRSAECFPEIVGRGRAAGAFVAANPGIRQLKSKTSPFLDSLQNVDLLAINREEAEALVPVIVSRFSEGDDAVPSVGADLPRLLRSGLKHGDFSIGLRHFINSVRKMGVEKVLITDGLHGSYLATARGLHHCPTRNVDVMGTAGAGDSFNSTLSMFLASGRPEDEALMAATLNAGSVVSQIDTQSGLLRFAEMERLLASLGDEISVAVID